MKNHMKFLQLLREADNNEDSDDEGEGESEREKEERAVRDQQYAIVYHTLASLEKLIQAAPQFLTDALLKV